MFVDARPQTDSSVDMKICAHQYTPHTKMLKRENDPLFWRLSDNFEPTPNPAWRRTTISTIEMLREIEHVQQQFQDAPPLVQNYIKSSHASMINFAHSSNLCNNVGMENLDETHDLCTAYLELGEPENRGELETIRTFECLLADRKLLDGNRTISHQAWSAHITLEDINELHMVLMKNRTDNPGKFRTDDAGPNAIQFRIYTLTDFLSDKLEGHDKLPLSEIFKLAALIMYNFITILPFKEGNGRMAQILGMHILSLAHFSPFPIAAYSNASIRDVWWDAIRSCRGARDQLPRDLTALLVESSWASWNRVKRDLERFVHDGKPLLGHVSIPKFIRRAKTQQEIDQFVHARWKLLRHSIRLPPQPSQEQLKAESTAAFAAFVNANQPNFVYELEDHCLVIIQQ